MQRFHATIALALLTAAHASHAHAALVRNISTGYDNFAQAPLPSGSIDTDYSVRVAGTNDLLTPLALTQADSRIPNSYVADELLPDSLWIALVDSTGGNQIPTGNYIYELTIDLTGFIASTAFISNLQVAADNAVVDISINGTPVFNQVPEQTAEEFREVRELGDSGLGLFQAGTNHITIETRNTGFGFGNGPSPSALRLSGIVEATPVPEPTSIAFLAIAGVTLARRRR
ncbi:MAG: PEP-CTERM sorting domain-containing protein [Planctomycetota bacterium]